MSYRTKSTDSFNTRKRFFIFDCVLKGKKSFAEEEFMQFEITNKLVQCYTAEYYQYFGYDKLKSIECSLSIGDIYLNMCKLESEHKTMFKTLEQRYFNEIFKDKFHEEDYNEIAQADTCYYCGITKKDIEALLNQGKLYKKNERGWFMEIDRKKPNQEYSPENCVPACYWCNNAKTDEFDDLEFGPIGEVIGSVLKARLQ